MDIRGRRVSVDGAPVVLTAHEFKLLSYLMHHQRKVVSRTELVEHIYDQDFDRDSNTIEVFVGRLRKKLGVDVIKTMRGQGYVMEPSDTVPPGDVA
jgi:two-component system OmpR family response regulator